MAVGKDEVFSLNPINSFEIPLEFFNSSGVSLYFRLFRSVYFYGYLLTRTAIHTD